MHKKIINILLTIIIVILIGTFAFSLYKIIMYMKYNKDNKDIQEAIKEDSIKVIEPEEYAKEIEYSIDFKSLKQQNSDTIGYLLVKGTDIDYIVVRGKDNSYYLNHNFLKKYNTAGWIFADYNNKFDLTDKNLVIYGHNTRDGSMFGTLKNVLTKEWFNKKENKKVLLTTEKGTFYYQVFSTYTIKPEDYYIKTSFNGDEEFNKFLEKISSRSIFKYNVDVDTSDSILTLSSCIDSGKKRVVLHAKLIKK